MWVIFYLLLTRVIILANFFSTFVNVVVREETFSFATRTGSRLDFETLRNGLSTTQTPVRGHRPRGPETGPFTILRPTPDNEG